MTKNDNRRGLTSVALLAAGGSFLWCALAGGVDTLVFRSGTYSSPGLGAAYVAAGALLQGLLGIGAAVCVVLLVGALRKRFREWQAFSLAAAHLAALILPVTLAVVYYVHKVILGYQTSATSLKGITYTGLVLAAAVGLTAGGAWLMARRLGASSTAWRTARLLAVAGGGLALGLIAVVLNASLRQAAARPGREQRNVILISIDSVRKDTWETYLEDHASPSLRRFASESRSFDNAFTTCSHSLASHASMLSGLFPPEHGALYKGKGPHTDLGAGIRDGVALVTERLAEAGYDTTAVLDNAWLGPAYGFDRGFGTFVNMGVAERLGVFSPLLVRSQSLAGLFFYYADQYVFREVHAGTRLLENLIRSRSRGRPFFFFFHMMDMHVPPDPPGMVRSRFTSGRFADLGGPQFVRLIDSGAIGESEMPDASRHFHRLSLGMLSEVDRFLGPVLETLREEKLLRNTLVILTSDHGDDFYEKGFLGHRHVYDNSTRIPLLLHVPEDTGGSVCNALVSVVDLAATVYRFTGVDGPDGLAGRDLLDCAALEADSERSILVVGTHPAEGHYAALVDREFKLIVNPDGSLELYDRIADRDESRNLASERPALAQSMADRLEVEFSVSDLGRDESIRADEVSPEVVERLKALGYLD